MALSNTAGEDLVQSRGFSAAETGTPSRLNAAVSWGAIAAGAAAAASLSLILLILGVGLGLSSVSPWARDGISATTFGVSTILWLTLTQLLASAMGGYLAGRLRTKWTDSTADEVYFRDTAHGFLAWAMASLATATLLTSVIGSILSGGAQAGASMIGGAASTANSAVGGVAASTRALPGSGPGQLGYFVDSLFRRDAAVAAAAAGSTASTPGQESTERATPAEAAEVGRIFMNLTALEPLPPEDVSHVARIVAQRTGLSQQDAETRVTTVYAKAQAKVRETETATRAAADTARTASAYSALWLFVSLLLGAFVASLSATFGGQRRDA